MEQWKSVDEVLNYAIGQEEEAAKFYIDLAGRMDRPWMSEVFNQFANEEKWHKKKLEDVKAGKRLMPVQEKVLDLKIGDYLVAPETTGELDYQAALVLAMKKEKKAFLLYNNLAATTDDEDLKNVFLGLAQEEAKHKLRFEVEYDDYVMTEN